jgi:hypothetical protein
MEGSRILGALVVLALQLLVAAGAFAEDKGRSQPVGNCSDVAFHEKTGRLFVAAGAAGLHLLEAKDGKPSLAGTVSDGSSPRKLALSGDRLYAADVKRGLVVFDIAGRDPVCTWKQENVPGMGVFVQDRRAYLAAGAAGLYVFDLPADGSPKLAGNCRTGAQARDVWGHGAYVFVADEQRGLAVVDVSVPSRPQMIAVATWDRQRSTAQAVWGEDKLVYVAAGRQGLVIVNVDDPRRPTVLSRYKSDPSGFAKGLCVAAGLVYLANANADNEQDNGLIVVDARDPKMPKLKGRCAFAGNVEGICLAGRHAFVANTSSGVRSIDISDPNHPSLIGSRGSAEESRPAEARQTAFLETEITPREREIIEYLAKTRSEVVQGREFTDLSTPANALLAVLSAYSQGDPNALKRVLPVLKLNPKLSSPELGKKILDSLGKCTIPRVEVENRPPQESDLAAIYTREVPGQNISEVLMFGYIQGAWRFLGGASNLIQDWRPYAKQVEAITRDILQTEAGTKR